MGSHNKKEAPPDLPALHTNRPSGSRIAKRKRSNVVRASSPISISSDDSPVQTPKPTIGSSTTQTRESEPARAKMPETPDIALREVLEAAFETNAKLCREHETKLLEVKQREQEATDRSYRTSSVMRQICTRSSSKSSSGLKPRTSPQKKNLKWHAVAQIYPKRSYRQH